MRWSAVGIGLLALLACTEQQTGSQPGAMQPSGSGGSGGAAGAMAGGGSGGAGGVPWPPNDAAVAGVGGMAAMDGSVPLDAGMTPDAAPPVDSEAPEAAADAGGDDDRCDVAVLDPTQPPRALELAGNLGTHDPALLEHDGVFYLWQTGPRLPGKTSTDLMDWSGAPSALGSANPAWINAQVPGATDLWAPDLSYFGGTFHLYYSASTFGSNRSCIGHATREALDAGGWQDQGSVICSDTDDDHNAIDPNVIVDREGTPWLAFGSFWSGIKMVRLTAEGTRADDELHAIASRGGGAIEAPFIVRRCGFYYLFVSFDRCCNGTSSTYNIRVGRSTDVLGPYVDREGTPLLEGGGTPIVTGTERYRGPGHNAVIFGDFRAYNVFHAYDADDGGRPTLRVAELAWDDQDWPVSGGP